MEDEEAGLHKKAEIRTLVVGAHVWTFRNAPPVPTGDWSADLLPGAIHRIWA